MNQVPKAEATPLEVTDKSLYSENTSVSGERHLWLKVIGQAIEDASRIEVLKELLERNQFNPLRLSAIRAELFEAQRSLTWLTTPSADLTEVCCLAGIDVNAILDRREFHLAGEFGVTATRMHLVASSIDASINSD